MSVSQQRKPRDYIDYNRTHYQSKERRNSRNRILKEKEEMRRELDKLKEEVKLMRLINGELVKGFVEMTGKPMTSDSEKCGLGSLLSMSCRGKAEAFARRLHSRLRSLGSQDETRPADESSWLAAHENPISLSQPRHSTDSDVYLDFDLLESPGSPEEELDDSELHRLINRDNLKHSRKEECHCPRLKELPSLRSPSNDSDSDGPFYDTTENEDEHRRDVDNDANSDSSKSQDTETGICVSSDDSSSTYGEESFVTISECVPQLCSLSDEVSMLSIKDDLASLEFDVPIPGKSDGSDGPETYISCLSVDKDLTCPETVETASQTQVLDIQVNKDEARNDSEGEEEERIPRVRRCSSLKTGLDLADVRTFLDEIPKVPNSAFEDLTDVDLSESPSVNSLLSTNMTHGVKADRILMPLFQQPGSLPNFLDLVRDNQVCLENAYVDDPLMFSIKGVVRVRNLDFHKSAYIRYSLDSWKTFADVQAVYVENSCDGFSDKFSFLIYAHTLSVGQRIEFACRFQCKGIQYWDNNKGANYCFQCLPATHNTPVAPITTMDDWGASFYYQEDDDENDDDDLVVGVGDVDLSTKAVQDFILNTLATKERVAQQRRKVDVLTIFVILVFSILFMYLQKAIYFTK
ncbi:hypothetical protein NQ315_006177 [Exocentrus adspersus]|uniref:CBM21 domain-containing protein n=1 Tax=Exocentrus adspersus TaxID=1586481 RepID=A0AAV8VZZ3_9CUCU|nr:hypothetical protein NQ315_006177 [Exocentrus adspersus]